MGLKVSAVGSSEVCRSWKMKLTLKISGLQQNVLGELLQIQRALKGVSLVCVRNLDLFLAAGCHSLFFHRV